MRAPSNEFPERPCCCRSSPCKRSIFRNGTSNTGDGYQTQRIRNRGTGWSKLKRHICEIATLCCRAAAERDVRTVFLTSDCASRFADVDSKRLRGSASVRRRVSSRAKTFAKAADTSSPKTICPTDKTSMGGLYKRMKFANVFTSWLPSIGLNARSRATRVEFIFRTSQR